MEKYILNPEQFESNALPPIWPREFIHITQMPNFADQQALSEAFSTVITGTSDNVLFSGGCRLEATHGKYFIQLTEMEVSVFELLLRQNIYLACNFIAVAVNPTFRHVMGVREFTSVTFQLDDSRLLVYAKLVEDRPIDPEYQALLDKASELVGRA